jgi:hypothetical protein
MEQRIWSMCSDSSVGAHTPVHIWDGGCEVWEMYENGELRHYRILQRTFLNKECTRMKEILERMDESAIPSEIYAKHGRKEMKWSIEKETREEDSPALWELTSLVHWIPPNVLHTAVCQ